MLRIGDIVFSHEENVHSFDRSHRVGVVSKLWPIEQQPLAGPHYCLVRWPAATDPSGYNDNEAYHPIETLEVIGYEVQL